MVVAGQWLWRSWQSGFFRYQRTRVQIQSSATFIEHLLTVCREDENKQKVAEMAHLKKYCGEGWYLRLVPSRHRSLRNEDQVFIYFA